MLTINYQTYSKGMRYFTRDIMLDHGKGSRVWDTEGNEYCDFTCALGPGLIGHNDARINTAIEKQLKKGISFSTPTQIEQDLCQKFTEIIPGCEACKLLKNGKDATTAAVKLARAYTGRDMILKSGYHGWDDWTIGIEPGAKGIPQAVKDLTVKFKYNDFEDIRKKIRNIDNMACVIMEPVMESGPEETYLEYVKRLCHAHGIILIFDEIVTGARFALGGAAEYYGVTPDLTCIGKAYGGGCAISAVCGRSDIMHLIDTGKAFISTTFGGECLSIAATLATIDILEQPGTYEHIWSLGQIMLSGLQRQIDFYGLNDYISTIGLPPHCGLTFRDAGKLDYLDLLSVYEEKMLNAGIIVSDTGFISLSHSKDDVEYFVLSAGRAIESICKAIEQDSLDGVLFGRRINPVFKRN
jgi:glutamate-1-semialdehyde aminotransferase